MITSLANYLGPNAKFNNKKYLVLAGTKKPKKCPKILSDRQFQPIWRKKYKQSVDRASTLMCSQL